MSEQEAVDQPDWAPGPHAPPWEGGVNITMEQLDFIILERSPSRAIKLMETLKAEGQITVTDWVAP